MVASRTCLDIVFAQWKTTWASSATLKCCPCDIKMKQLSLQSLSTESVQSRKHESKLGITVYSTLQSPLQLWIYNIDIIVPKLNKSMIQMKLTSVVPGPASMLKRPGIQGGRFRDMMRRHRRCTMKAFFGCLCDTKIKQLSLHLGAYLLRSAK